MLCQLVLGVVAAALPAPSLSYDPEKPAFLAPRLPAVSVDGRHVALLWHATQMNSGLEDYSLRILDAPSGRLLQNLPLVYMRENEGEGRWTVPAAVLERRLRRARAALARERWLPLARYPISDHPMKNTWRDPRSARLGPYVLETRGAALAVRRGDRTVLARSMRRWVVSDGDCKNLGFVDVVHADLQLGVILLDVWYTGDDTCVEPLRTYVLLRLPHPPPAAPPPVCRSCDCGAESDSGCAEIAAAGGRIVADLGTHDIALDEGVLRVRRAGKQVAAAAPPDPCWTHAYLQEVHADPGGAARVTVRFTGEGCADRADEEKVVPLP